MKNMLTAVGNEVDSMQEEKVNVNRDVHSKNKEMLQIKNTLTEKKKPLMNSLLDWTQLKKAYLSLRYVRRNFQDGKTKRKKD